MSKRALQYMLPVLSLITLPILVWALNTSDTGYQVASTETTVDAHGVCKSLVANGGQTYFVPTKTSTEWGSFLANPPAGMSVSDCLPNEYTDTYTFVAEFECPNPYNYMHCGRAYSPSTISADGRYIFAFENAYSGSYSDPKLHIYEYDEGAGMVGLVTSITGLPGYDQPAAGFAINSDGSRILIQTRRSGGDTNAIPFYVYVFDGTNTNLLYSGTRDALGYVAPAISDDGNAIALDGRVYEYDGSSYNVVFDNGDSTVMAAGVTGTNLFLGDDAFLVKQQGGARIVQKQANGAWQAIQNFSTSDSSDIYYGQYSGLSPDRSVLAINSKKPNSFTADYVVEIYERDADGPTYTKRGEINTGDNGEMTTGLSASGKYLSISDRSWDIRPLLSGGSAAAANPLPASFTPYYYSTMGDISESATGVVVVNDILDTLTSGSDHGVFRVYQRAPAP